MTTVPVTSSTPTSSAASSAMHTPAHSTPSVDDHTNRNFDSINNHQTDPLPTFSSLDLSLSRDQGTHHVAGYGAGSEAHTLSHVATANHGVLAKDILAKTGGSVAGSNALSPHNLPTHPASNLGTETPSTAAPSVSSSTVATPGDGLSRVATPALASAAPSSHKPTNAPPPPQSQSTNLMPPPPTTKPPLKEKKSVFGKLFERNNASSQSIASSVSPATPGSAGMERGGGGSTDTNGTGNGSAAPGAPGHSPIGGAPIARKPSKKEEKRERKEQEKREKEEEKERRQQMRQRAPSEDRSVLASDGGEGQRAPRSRSGSHGAKEGKEGGMGQALNDFMRNKVQRRTSQTSRKSDDGRSEHDRAESHAGDDTRSRHSATPSLTKKYGVCEKVVIGKGATAVVKLAHKWDRSTERLYAVKEFRKRRKNETEKEYVKKLTSEFCISSTLHHHNIVETVDLVQDEQNHWCEVMEYCPGGDLYAAIKKGDMGAPEINSYFKQILAGVAYLHSMGVAHRDIKPENLLLDAKGHVKITDFGVSDVFRMCWEKTTHLSKGLCGSEPYIAPEQFDHKEYDARLVDVWACAVVFYCMHFQELPWRVAKISDPSFGPYVQMYNETSSPPPLSNLVPRECRSIIKRMLDPDPRTRATTEEIIADAWFERIQVIPALEGILPPTPNLPL